MALLWILIIIFLALVMEIIDTSLGMMYGTMLSPILIGYGFESVMVIPAILISQAVGGISGTLSHQNFKNADFKGLTMDTKIVLAMVIPGLLVVVLGVFAAVTLPHRLIKTYIGILVIIMSAVCISPVRFRFAWWKHNAIGILAAFNKALSGGGFGPITSTGGIIGGLKSNVSIATTTFAEVYICLGAFVLYLIFLGTLDIILTGGLCIGSSIGGIFGPYLSSKVRHNPLRKAIGMLGIISGAWLLWRIMI